MTTIPQDLYAILDFLRRSENLKSTLRTAWTQAGRQESTAEHSWRLSLFTMLICRFFPQLDATKMLRMSIVHDLGEAINGDIPAPAQTAGKADQEREDLLDLLRPLPQDMRRELFELWEEYENAQSAEARVVKALDKFETLLQHAQGATSSQIDYGFDLDYGKKYTGGNDIFDTIRDILDNEIACRLLPTKGTP